MSYALSAEIKKTTQHRESTSPQGSKGISLPGVPVLQNKAEQQLDEKEVTQEKTKHLPHEAWHVVQQRQGRVQATKQMKMGVAINDDAGLESEADVMGEKALQNSGSNAFMSLPSTPALQRMRKHDTLQLKKEDEVETSIKEKKPLLSSTSAIKSQLPAVLFELTSINGEHTKSEGVKKDVLVQRVLSQKQAMRLMRRLSRCAQMWKRIYESVESLINEIGSASTTNLTALINILKQRYAGDQIILERLSELQGIVDELEQLANEIDHIGGDILRAARRDDDSSGDESDDEGGGLGGMFEGIKDMISQE